MPSFGTPESLLPRSDSKNPATTCKGLTSSGRPCRRALASRDGSQGVLAVLPHVGHTHNAAAAYFCWQHKDQASNLVDDAGEVVNLQHRSSIETLVEKLGVLDIEDRDKKKRRRSSHNTVRRDSMPQKWSVVAGPLLTVPEDPFGRDPRPAPAQSRPVRRRTRDRKEQVHVSFFCCMKTPKEEPLPPARPSRPIRPGLQALSARPGLQEIASIPYQSSLQVMPNTLEGHLSFIPNTLPHETRTSLMTEISKPLTPSDHESGYIYIFWLTPNTISNEVAREAEALLTPGNSTVSPRNDRRTSDVLRQHNDPNQNKTIMLKIGRASNVHRRMVQWSQQCGHHITLLRYYPYHKSNPSPGPSPGTTPSASSRTTATLQHMQITPSPVQKASLVPRVERLIHLELAEKRVLRNCDGCGKEHREWFEVEASRKGVREVDDVVRRWVEWGQRQKNATR